MGVVKQGQPLPKLFPAPFRCEEFTSNELKEAKTVILAPIGLKFFPDRTVMAWACSFGVACGNRSCRYAKRGLEEDTG